MNYLLSTCGTSILTNTPEAELRTLVTRNANAKRSELAPDDLRRLEAHVAARRQAVLATGEPEAARRLSAELNGIISYYDGKLKGRERDQHLLLVSDTFLGEAVGEILQSWLSQRGLSVQLFKLSGLVTNDYASFRSAMTTLIRWCEETLPGYQRAGYRVVFNLTGGFKSAQGFMQTIGMFYADESIYIFESGSLLRIPKLPIRLDVEGLFERHAPLLRLLGNGQTLSAQEARELPEMLLFELDGQVTLSEWGELIWQQGKRALYERGLLDPLPGLHYGASFAKSVEKQGLTKAQLAVLGERLDQLSLVAHGRLANLRGLDFKALKSDPKPPSTHECDVWSDDKRRVFGHYEESVFVVDALARGLR
jgi:putative CRISPR-associated protein (TIGR02619 family)